MNTIYIGHDPREQQAYDVAESSILRRTDDATVIPIQLKGLDPSIWHRPTGTKDGKLWCPISEAPMATEFAISRFCVPFLHRTGWALFVDCDILCLADIQELFDMADDRYAVMVVKHLHAHGQSTKMDGQSQTYYQRKNWSSVVLWNCDHAAHQRLTIKDLNEWPGRDLHAFKWLKDEEIGELPLEWNYLAGVSPIPFNRNLKIVHYTLGGPWISGWKGGPMDKLWMAEREKLPAPSHRRDGYHAQ